MMMMKKMMMKKKKKIPSTTVQPQTLNNLKNKPNRIVTSPLSLNGSITTG